MKIEVDAARWSPVPDLRELAAHKDLFLTLAYRDIRVRYAQTALGLGWAVVQPLATLVVLVLVFGKAVKVDSAGVPYPLFAMCGITAWTYFAHVMKESGSSIINSQEMVRKIYFPRLVIPLSKAAVGVIDLAVATFVLAVMFLAYRMPLGPHAIVAPFAVLVMMVASVSMGIWISALTIRFRDIQHVVPFMIQFGLFITPVAYPASAVSGSLPDWGVDLYYLNPLAGPMETLRWSLFDTPIDHGRAWVSYASTAVIAVTSLLSFRALERHLADLV
jgi:lipopolysaccharide transport system permease protein